jgi:hypothetical protein
LTDELEGGGGGDGASIRREDCDVEVSTAGPGQPIFGNVEYINRGQNDTEFTVIARLVDPNGTIIAEVTAAEGAVLQPQQRRSFGFTLTVPDNVQAVGQAHDVATEVVGATVIE